jgi:hypothetical protein
MGFAVIVVNIVVAVVCAIVSAYLAVENIPDAKPNTGSKPEATDGTVIRKIYGTVWVDDSQVLAYMDLPPEPITTKAGKK